MEEVADFLYDLPKDYGLAFDIVHYIVSLQGERADLGDDFESVTKLNPLVRLLLTKTAKTYNPYPQIFRLLGFLP